MNEWYLQFDLTATEAGIWQLLQQAVGSYKAPFHHAVVATINHSMPEARTVILRKVLVPERKLFFHTDIRSPKMEQLQWQPQVTWLFYDPGLRMQLRCYASAVVHTNDAVADAGWEHSRLASRLTYTPSSAPGTFLEEPELIDLNRVDVEQQVLDTARSQFAVVETRVTSIDWVFLHYLGNRRALFNYETGAFQWKQV